MERRSFLKISGIAAGSLIIPVCGNAIAAEELLNPVGKAFKKSLADAAMNAATKAGASYCDVRIGRYVNQFITTRDTRVRIHGCRCARDRGWRVWVCFNQ